jgi:hypothetical protein
MEGLVSGKFPKDFLDLLASITAKRPKTVIDHILQHGHVTTEELQNLYGYEHPPRAARDVREQGIPLETFRVENSQGRKIAAYRFADPSAVRSGVLAGRKVISKEFKDAIASQDGETCQICATRMELRYLQVDHRVPYQVAGEGDGGREVADYMLICGSCNRSKSWSCEHCSNWLSGHDADVCQSCYWASPEEYTHIATTSFRRVDVTWSHEEVTVFDRAVRRARQTGLSIAEFIKEIVKKYT